MSIEETEKSDSMQNDFDLFTCKCLCAMFVCMCACVCVCVDICVSIHTCLYVDQGICTVCQEPLSDASR